ncbi:MAG: hypothetical protein AB7I30_19425, partial [Isosphaeraceae bacterium]
MRISLTSLVRLLGLVALAVSALAVAIGKAVPDVPVFRTPTAPRYFGVNGSVFQPPAPRSYLLDGETGVLREAPTTGPHDRIEYLTCSPWTIEPGRFEF